MNYFKGLSAPSFRQWGHFNGPMHGTDPSGYEFLETPYPSFEAEPPRRFPGCPPMSSPYWPGRTNPVPQPVRPQSSVEQELRDALKKLEELKRANAWTLKDRDFLENLKRRLHELAEAKPAEPNASGESQGLEPQDPAEHRAYLKREREAREREARDAFLNGSYSRALPPGSGLPPDEAAMERFRRRQADEDAQREADKSELDRIREEGLKLLLWEILTAGAGELMSPAASGARSVKPRSMPHRPRGQVVEPAPARPPATTRPSDHVYPSGPRNGRPTGRRSVNPRDANELRKRATEVENESADALARKGYQVEQNPTRPQGSRQPDYVIEGKDFDAYGPNTSNPRGIVDEINRKVGERQADRIVVNLKDSNVSRHELRQALKDYGSNRLKEVILIEKDGTITKFYP